MLCYGTVADFHRSLQFSAKRWRQGCVIPRPGPLWLRRGEFTQPSLPISAEYCTESRARVPREPRMDGSQLPMRRPKDDSVSGGYGAESFICRRKEGRKEGTSQSHKVTRDKCAPRRRCRCRTSLLSKRAIHHTSSKEENFTLFSQLSRQSGRHTGRQAHGSL